MKLHTNMNIKTDSYLIKCQLLVIQGEEIRGRAFFLIDLAVNQPQSMMLPLVLPFLGLKGLYLSSLGP